MSDELPPQGTDYNTVLTLYPGSLYVGLFVGNPSVCPPEPFATLVQPAWPGYTMLRAQDLSALDVPGNTPLAAVRFLANWRPPQASLPVTLNGWFAAVKFNDNTFAVVAIEPFETPMTLTPQAPSATVNVVLSSSPSLAGPGQSAVAVGALAFQSTAGGSNMASVFKGQQRATIQTAIDALRQLIAWDQGLLLLPPTSALAPFAILPILGDSTFLPQVPDLTISYTGAATEMIEHLSELLLMTE